MWMGPFSMLALAQDVAGLAYKQFPEAKDLAFSPFFKHRMLLRCDKTDDSPFFSCATGSA